MSEDPDQSNAETEPVGSSSEEQQGHVAEEQQSGEPDEQPAMDQTSQDLGEPAAEEPSPALPSAEDETSSTVNQATQVPAGEYAVEEAVTESVDEPAPVKQESRAGRFLKRALRWVVGLLFVFTLGVIAMQFARVQPMSDEVNRLNRALIVSETALAQAQAEVERLEGVEAQNEALTNELVATEARLTLANILLDVTRAQLALAQDDPAGVALALQGTGDRLNDLRQVMAASEIDGLRERLVLVLSEVDSDSFAAERDLEIVANTLFELKQELGN